MGAATNNQPPYDSVAVKLILGYGQKSIRELCRWYVESTVALCRDNKVEAAKMLGITTTNLYTKLKYYRTQDNLERLDKMRAEVEKNAVPADFKRDLLADAAAIADK